MTETTKTPPPAPVVHLNGTDGEVLVEELYLAMRALKAAAKAMQIATPNARDYPKEWTFSLAIDAHAARLGTIGEIHDELQTIAENVAEQVIERRARARR